MYIYYYDGSLDYINNNDVIVINLMVELNIHFVLNSSLRMDMYGGDEDTKKPWTEQETLLLLEVRITFFLCNV